MVTCKNCKWYRITERFNEEGEEYDYYSTGSCQKRAPVVIKVSGYGDFPIVSSDMWCGDFKNKGGLK